MGHKILVIDSQQEILQGVERVLAHEEDIAVLTASGDQAALEIVGGQPIDIVISFGPLGEPDDGLLQTRLGQRFPELDQILFAEGEDDWMASLRDALGEHLTVINEPMDADRLRSEVRKKLDPTSEQADEAALIKHAGVTPAQLERAARIRKRLQNDKPLGEILVEQGVLSRSDYNKALQVRRSQMSLVELLREDGHLDANGLTAYREARAGSPGKDDRVLLVDSNLVSEEQFLQALGQKHGIPYVEPEIGMVDTQLLGKTSIRYLHRHLALPVRICNDAVTVILAEPLDLELRGELQRIFGLPISINCCTRAKITEALNTLERLRGETEGDNSVQYREITEVASGDETGEEAVQICDYLLMRAIQLGASDLHIEPQNTKIRVRVRVDGVLQQLTDLPLDFAPRVVSRIKILAGVDIAEKRLHQDGRIFVKVEGREVDIRVSTYVSTFGETIVMRLLDRNKGLLPLDKVGFEPRVHASIDSVVLQTSSGLVLITGPTGSGKTTTLYSFIDHCNDPTEKVITAEDPVEFVLDGLIQCSVNPKTGPTFGDSLRAIVRQDPDTIVVGEIRDHETASLALESALTGHKVFSTFHTEDAVGSFVRLLEMKMEPFLVASTVSAVVAQRLVRRICDKCRKPGSPSRPELRFLGMERSDFNNVEIWDAGGCAHCEGTGYKGRLGVHEVLLPDDDFRDAVLQRAPAKVLREQARKLPEFMTLQENGLLKVASGLTSLSEVVSNLPRDTAARSIATLTTIAKIGRFS